MKVLWFTNTSSLFNKGEHPYHGGGWIESLEEALVDVSSVELGIAFFHNGGGQKVERNGTTYYPIKVPRGMKKKFLDLFYGHTGILWDDQYVASFHDIVADFQPDLIQIFGTERAFGRILNHVRVPVVIHLQGLMGPIAESYFPPGHSPLSTSLSAAFVAQNITGNSPIQTYRQVQKQAVREREVLSRASYVMGRTEWDRNVAKTYSQSVEYFHIDEILRKTFYEPQLRRNPFSGKAITIVSTLSPSFYKGLDTILRSARLLRESYDLSFEWNVIGLSSTDRIVQYFEQNLGIRSNELGVKYKSKRSALETKELLLNADVYVHSSYIENGSNSVSEAQILGLPVVASSAGGVSTTVQDQRTGVLVPPNGCWETVAAIMRFVQQPVLSTEMAHNARAVALERHDSKRIVSDVIAAYEKMVS